MGHDADKKILYVAGSHLPTPKAFGYQTLQMCQAFEEVGKKVCLSYPVASHDKSRGGDELQSYYNLRRGIEARTFQVPDVLGLLTRLGLRASIIQKPAFYLVTAYYMAKIAYFLKENQAQFTTIFFRDFNLLWMFLIFAGRKSVEKVCFEVHSLPASSFKRSLQTQFIKRLNRVICLTNATKDILTSQGVDRSKINVACDGVDIDNFAIELDKSDARKRAGIPINATVLLYIGRFHTNGMEKGIPEIIRSSKYLINTERVKYLFVGGPMDQVIKYRKMIADEGLIDSFFEFRDKVPVSEVPIYLQAADVLLMPHPAGIEFYSYFVSPLKLFEYMASGRPIVASSLPAIKEILTNFHNAILCKPGDVQDLAAAIDWILSNQDRAQLIGATAKSESLRYSWRGRAQNISDFLFQKAAQ